MRIDASDHDAERDRPLFANDEGGRAQEGRDNASARGDRHPWKIAIVDDDEGVHAVTRLVLSDFRFKDRPLRIYSETSAQGAKRLLRDEPDIAAILLDVVMETDHAGLDVTRYIREDLGNRMTRIILRTGQPGEAPEHRVISQYDINDYREKSELTAQKLVTAITTALRAYDDLQTILELTTSKESLERLVQDRTAELAATNARLQAEIDNGRSVLAALRHNEMLLAEAQRIAGIGNFEWNPLTGELRWSDQVGRILGIEPRSQTGTLDTLLDTVLPEDRNRVRDAIGQTLSSGGVYDVEHAYLRPDGSKGHARQQGEARRDADAKVVRLVGTIQDITARRAADETMRKLSTAIEQTADSVVITDRNGVVEYANQAFTDITGYSRDEVLGNTPRMLKSGRHTEDFYRRLWQTILRGEVFTDVMVNRRKNGEFFYESKTITPQRDAQGTITHFISTSKDVTEQILFQERIHYLAHHDSLTGLPNRVLLADRLDEALTAAQRHHRRVAVAFLDIDRFKVINDTLGHDVGDELLKHVGQRLLGCVRGGDTVARLGGDEFAIVLADVAAHDDVARVTAKILAAMRLPIQIGERELFATASIGISLSPEHGDDGSTLLKCADVAMYNAKAAGKNTFQFYAGRDDAKALERLGLETGLRRALDQREFFLVFQPQICPRSGRLAGMEALLRWRHPDGRVVPPGEFIPLLEETGMIVEVGDWVIRNACDSAKAMITGGLPPHRVAVNVSLAQFRQKDFARRVAEIVGESGFDPRLLELEVTEGVVAEDMQAAVGILDDLHALGVHLSIDDFGTGYSSMRYLRMLPFDTLKIDGSFVRDVTESGDSAAVVTAIISLARALDLSVVAEGVETAAQKDFVGRLGCDLIQGHVISPPLPAAEFREFATRFASGAAGARPRQNP